MLIGFMASAGELSLAFIVAVFLANFPEAMSASGTQSCVRVGGRRWVGGRCRWAFKLRCQHKICFNISPSRIPPTPNSSNEAHAIHPTTYTPSHTPYHILALAALMKRNGDATSKIIFMWSILFVGTGAIAFLTVLAFPEKKEGIPEPEYQRFAATASEGVAGGAMMACIATAMLPEVSTASNPHYTVITEGSATIARGRGASRPRHSCTVDELGSRYHPTRVVRSAAVALLPPKLFTHLALHDTMRSHPQAFEEGGDMAGVSTLMGFLASLVVKLSMEGTHEAHGTVMEAACPSPLMPPLP